MMAGARPVFADIDPDAADARSGARSQRAITPRTRAILPVHLYGQPADMAALAAIAARHSLALVEDCCQAHLATVRRAAGRHDRRRRRVQLLPDEEPRRARRRRRRRHQRRRARRADQAAAQRRPDRPLPSRRSPASTAASTRCRRRSCARGCRCLPRLDRRGAARWPRAIATRLAGSAGRRAAGARSRPRLSSVRRAGRQARRDAAGASCARAASRRWSTIRCRFRASRRWPRCDPADCPVADRACDEVLSLPLHPGADDADGRRRRGGGARLRRCTDERTDAVRALITGGAGFIGSHLVRSAARRAATRSLVLDNLSTGSIDNIAHLKGRAGLRVHHRHGRQRAAARRADRSQRRRLPSRRRRRRQADRRAAGAHDRDQRARHRGRAQAREQEEEAGRRSPRPPRSTARATTCRSARTRIWCWARRRSTAGPTPAARRSTSSSRSPTGRSASCRSSSSASSTPSGRGRPGQYGMVMPNFVRQALAGEPITVFGDGTQSARFTHVADVVGALLKLVDEPKAIGQVINIGNTRGGHDPRSSPSGCATLTGSTSPIKFDPLRRGLRVGLRGHAAARARSDARSTG